MDATSSTAKASIAASPLSSIVFQLSEARTEARRQSRSRQSFQLLDLLNPQLPERSKHRGR